MGKGILCKYSRIERGEDTEICKMPGGAGEEG